MSTTETFGKGGLGNAAPASGVQHAVEPVTEKLHPDHAIGRGGAANLSVGEGHYDKTGGHHTSPSGGRGGYGGIKTAHHVEGKHARKASIVDIVIGSTMVTLGKVTKNAAMIEKGMARKSAAPDAEAPSPTAPATTA